MGKVYPPSEGHVTQKRISYSETHIHSLKKKNRFYNKTKKKIHIKLEIS